jgi:hypothetical protein
MLLMYRLEIHASQQSQTVGMEGDSWTGSSRHAEAVVAVWVNSRFLALPGTTTRQGNALESQEGRVDSAGNLRQNPFCANCLSLKFSSCKGREGPNFIMRHHHSVR